MIRIWIDKQTLQDNITEDGDFALRVEDVYFFKREEISNEEGYHIEFNSNGDGGFELYVPYRDFRMLATNLTRKVLDYAESKTED